MKKLLSLACFLACCANLFAEDGPAQRQQTLCTIVVSPCDDVPNTLFEGEATDKQIKDAQEQMLHDCGM